MSVVSLLIDNGEKKQRKNSQSCQSSPNNSASAEWNTNYSDFIST